MSKLPQRIDRATFDRILRRAAELQTGGRDVGDDGMSEEEVLALGQEVGLPEAQMRQALMEERFRVTPAETGGLLDRVIAPADFQAQRVVQGTPEQVSAALTHWLEHFEQLVPQRSAGGLTTYERMHSLAVAMRRASAIFDAGRGKAYLDGADLVSAVIAPLEPGFCHVTLAASLKQRRSAFIGGGAALGSTGLAGAAIISAIGGVSLLPMIPLIAGAGVGWLVVRGFRPSAERARIGLERALDALEQRPTLPPSGEPKSALLGREVGDAVREFTREVRKAFDK